jgi:hypothetical protein
LHNGELKLESKKHIKYRKQVANNNDRETYIIDVITEDFLADYLKIIDTEFQQIVTRLKQKKERLKVQLIFLLINYVRQKTNLNT